MEGFIFSDNVTLCTPQNIMQPIQFLSGVAGRTLIICGASFNIFQKTTMSECQSSASCPYVGRITKLETHYDHITPLMNKIDSKMDQVILSLGRVEVLESKHNGHSEALNRAFNRIESIERQSADNQKALNDLISQIKGMSRVAIFFWATMGSVLAFIANKVL